MVVSSGWDDHGRLWSELEVETQQEQGREEGRRKQAPTEMLDCNTGREHELCLSLSHHHEVLESSYLCIMNSILHSYNDRPVSFCGCWQARIRRRGDLHQEGTPSRPTLLSSHRTHFSHPPTLLPFYTLSTTPFSCPTAQLLPP